MDGYISKLRKYFADNSRVEIVAVLFLEFNDLIRQSIFLYFLFGFLFKTIDISYYYDSKTSPIEL